MKTMVCLSLVLLVNCSQTRNTTTAFSDVPEWAKKAVWYQIFPERFRNGDTSNDPTLDDIRNSWPHDQERPFAISNWTGDWYAAQAWEDAGEDFYYHVQRRRYGGDLQGVLDKLDYLTDLGITAIYFNPLFESPSLHKYDGAYYHHIDDNFGPSPQTDREIIAKETPQDPSTWQWTTADSLFLKLLSECHRRGMRVIIDGVFNHVGLNFWAFEDLRKKQQRSRFASWFTVKAWDDPGTKRNEFDYAGWFDVKELPEIREDEHGLISEAREYVFHSVRRWMDPNGDGDPSDGVDGWRLDVAEMVGEPFWRDLRKVVRGINPDAYIVGEVWWQDWPNDKMFNAGPWLKGDMFDAVMNYRWAKEVVHFFIDRKNKISASEFDARITQLREDYRADVNYVLLNLLDSHDTDRLASQIVNPDDSFDHRDTPKENLQYEVRRPKLSEIRIQKLIALFQATYLGAPMIYYGDEAGMWGADDPDCRKPMLWPELDFDIEKSHPLGKARPKDRNRFNHDLFAHYKKVLGIRNAHAALQTGEYKTLLVEDSKDVFAFLRSKASESLIVVINNSNQAQTIGLNTPLISSKSSWTDLMTDQSFQAEGELLTLNAAAKSGLILK